jgi:glutathione S-transferase
MLRFYDYLPSQNAYKVRLLLSHLGLPYEQRLVSIFEGESRTPEFLARNPAGAVPVLEVAPGDCIAESNAILCYLAEGSPYLPADRLARARVMQWLFFEADYVQSTIATLRHWSLTGKLARRAPQEVANRRGGGEHALDAIERGLAKRSFLAGERMTIADIAVFAYAHRAEEAGFDLAKRSTFRGWVARVEAEPGHLAEEFPYSIDPHSSRELG